MGTIHGQQATRAWPDPICAVYRNHVSSPLRGHLMSELCGDSDEGAVIRMLSPHRSRGKNGELNL